MKEYLLDETEESFCLFGVEDVTYGWWLRIEIYVGYVQSPDEDTESFDSTCAYGAFLNAENVTGAAYSKGANAVVLYADTGPVWAVEGIDDAEKLYKSLMRQILDFKAGVWKDSPRRF